MPDLSQFPTYISIPLLVVFALLILVSRFLDLTEKWDNWVSRRQAKQHAQSQTSSGTSANKITTAAQHAVTESSPVSGPELNRHAFPLNRILIYAFFGGIAIPFTFFIFVYSFAPNPPIAQQHLPILLTTMVYAALAALLVKYLSNRYPIILHHRVTIMAAGLVVSSLIAIPFNIASMLYAYTKFYP